MISVENIKKKLEEIKKKFDEKKQNHDSRNSWENRYERLKNTDHNKNARKNFQKSLTTIYADQELSEEQEAILFSQAYHRLFLKNPAASKFPDFDEFEIEKTDSTYIVKGFCDCTNSYGAQVREKIEYEICKCNNEWTCITDVGAKLLTWILICILIIVLPSIIAYCSIPSF